MDQRQTADLALPASGVLPRDRLLSGGSQNRRHYRRCLGAGNIVLALQAQRGWLRPIPRREQNEIAERFIRQLGSVPRAPSADRVLSGGNQQKVLLSRWLLTKPQFLILDEPTRGIDVGAHAEIIRLIETLCAAGAAGYLF
ncbi:ATP-binding cassette domain-containing protein [Klebsiella pneumoniae]|uniref:ATP-binding cassette domain-containing protein n=1 Tax=Klebsiella pneumoniae TaxID=573 RepID=A0A939NN00_KLEPN|nr:ATP-binding cassette domain-containing protein [Klebsiella pneumoniae]